MVLWICSFEGVDTCGSDIQNLRGYLRPVGVDVGREYAYVIPMGK